MDTVLLFVNLLSLHTIKATRSIDARITQLLNCMTNGWICIFCIWLDQSLVGLVMI